MSQNQHASQKDHSFNQNNDICNTKDGLFVTTLYVPSLGKKVRHNHLFNHFSAFGTVKNVKIYNKPTRSFAYIRFTEAESATKAMANQLHTIAGQRIRVAIADRRHQETPLEIGQSDFATPLATHILDLNDDCILEIFSTIDIRNLCAVARTCTRLRDIANRIFTRRYEVCEVLTMVESFPEARRMLVTFGSIITELWVGGSPRNQVIVRDLNSMSNEQWEVLLDLAIRCCSDRLKTLSLNLLVISDVFAPKLKPLFNNLRKLDILFSKIDGVNKVIFDGCNSLVDFCVVGTKLNLSCITENIFPELETFQYATHLSPFDASKWEIFISRHNFKRLALEYFSVVAKNCKKLEELVYLGSKALNTEEDFAGILSLDNLKKLKISSRANFTKLIPNLNALQSLQCLEFQHIMADSEFTKVLSQLKTIRILRLRNCQRLVNLQLLGEMHQLTELLIYPTENVDLDIVSLIKSLNKLESLHLNSVLFKMNEKIYLRILNAILGRNVRSQQILEITCYLPVDVFDTGANVTRLMPALVSAQLRPKMSLVKPFSFSDAIFNLQCVRNNSHIVKLRPLPYYDGWVDVVDVFHSKL